LDAVIWDIKRISLDTADAELAGGTSKLVGRKSRHHDVMVTCR